MPSTKMPAGLPTASELVPFAHGAAGHEGVSSNASGSLVIKPCTQAEIDFYESAKDHPEFQAHMPTFMGSLALNNDPQVQQIVSEPGAVATGEPSSEAAPKDWIPSGGKQLATSLAIVLENAAAGFKHPCVLDLKLGARLWDDAAPKAKRQRLDQVASETTSGSLGFRVAGMKVWLEGSADQGTVEVNTDVKDGYKSFNKVYGRNLTADSVEEAFIRVVGGKKTTSTTSSNDHGNGGEDDSSTRFKRPRATMLLKRFLREVESIKYVIENQESRMYSASILLVLEGDDAALEAGLENEEKSKQNEELGDEDEDGDDDNGEDEELGPRVLEVRLIDFAHASWTPGQGPDENALRGVRNVQRIVEGLLASTSPS